LQWFLRWADQLIANNNGQMLLPAEWNKMTKSDFDSFRSLRTPSTGLKPRMFIPSAECSQSSETDDSLYPVLCDQQQWSQWNESVLALARTHGVAAVFDPTYKPISQAQVDELKLKQRFVYSILDRTVQTDQGRAFVSEHESDCDAQRVFAKLVLHAAQLSEKSTKEMLLKEQLLQFLKTTRLDSTWRGTTVEFIVHWREQMRMYNEITPANERFNPGQKKRLLQAAVERSPPLKAVHAMDNNRVLARQASLDYVGYSNVLLSEAAQMDSSVQSVDVRSPEALVASGPQVLQNTSAASCATPQDASSIHTQVRLYEPLDTIELLGECKQNEADLHVQDFDEIILYGPDDDHGSDELTGNETDCLALNAPTLAQCKKQAYGLDTSAPLIETRAHERPPMKPQISASITTQVAKSSTLLNGRTFTPTPQVSWCTIASSLADHSSHAELGDEKGRILTVSARQVGHSRIKDVSIGTVAGVTQVDIGAPHNAVVADIPQQHAYLDKGKTVTSRIQLEELGHKVNDQSNTNVDGGKELLNPSADGYVLVQQRRRGFASLRRVQPPTKQEQELSDFSSLVFTAHIKENHTVLDDDLRDRMMVNLEMICSVTHYMVFTVAWLPILCCIHFATWLTIKVIQCVFDNINRMAHETAHYPFPQYYKDKFPALHVHRRHELEMMETTCVNAPTIAAGMMTAQSLVETDVMDLGGSGMIHTLDEQIQKWGAHDRPLRDRNKEEVGTKDKVILTVFQNDKSQSDEHRHYTGKAAMYWLLVIALLYRLYVHIYPAALHVNWLHTQIMATGETSDVKAILKIDGFEESSSDVLHKIIFRSYVRCSLNEQGKNRRFDPDPIESIPRSVATALKLNQPMIGENHAVSQITFEDKELVRVLREHGTWNGEPQNKCELHWNETLWSTTE